MCAALAEQWKPALALAELSEQRGESALAELPEQRRESGHVHAHVGREHPKQRA